MIESLRSFILIGVPVIIFLNIVPLLVLIQSLPVLPDIDTHNIGLFCERIHNEPQTIRQPVSAWSSLIYNFFAVIIIFVYPYHKNPETHFAHSWIVKAITFVIFLVLGFGSFAYHAFLTAGAGVLDYLGLAMVAALVNAYSITRWFRKGLAVFLSVLASLFIVIMVVRLVPDYLYGLDTTFIVIPFGLASGALLESIRLIVIYRRKDDKVPVASERSILLPANGAFIENFRWLVVSAVMMLAGFIFWLVDRSGIICNPNDLLQLHALWHILTGYAALLFYFYMMLFDWEMGKKSSDLESDIEM